VSFKARSVLVGRDRALQPTSQWMSLIPGLTGQYLRRAFLSRALAECDRTAVIEYGTTFCRAGARVGPHVYIGIRCHLGLIHLERDVLVASGVHIPSGGNTHGIDDVTRPIREQSGDERLVRVGAGAWIGERAVIMADVGADAVVGAGAVVTRPVPAWAVSAGVPARVLRRRNLGAAV
jgi:acetyltransferase-like isoleucine patch superfamily enzyme